VVRDERAERLRQPVPQVGIGPGHRGGVARRDPRAVGGDQQRRTAKRGRDRLAQGAVQSTNGHRPGKQGQRVVQVPRQLEVRRCGPPDEGVGQRSRGDLPTGRVQRERADQQRGQVERLVGRRRGVQHGRHRLARQRQRPGQRPGGPVALLDRAVREQGRVDPAGPADHPPASRVGHHPAYAVDLDRDLGQGGQREQQRVVHLAELAAHQLDRSRVAQWEQDGRGEAAHRPAGRRPGQPEHRQLATAPARLVRERVDLGDGAPGPVGVPPDGAGLGQHLGAVGDGQDGTEPHAEATDGAVVALAGGAQRAERLDTGRVQRGAGVRGCQDAAGERQEQAAGAAVAGRGVGGVLGQLHNDPVAVAAAHQVVLGVRVLTEPGRRRGPRVQHTLAQRGGAERILGEYRHVRDATGVVVLRSWHLRPGRTSCPSPTTGAPAWPGAPSCSR
jgi:hypothetical protein